MKLLRKNIKTGEVEAIHNGKWVVLKDASNIWKDEMLGYVGDFYYYMTFSIIDMEKQG